MGTRVQDRLVAFRMPSWLYERVREESDRRGKKVSELLREYVEKGCRDFDGGGITKRVGRDILVRRTGGSRG